MRFNDLGNEQHAHDSQTSVIISPLSSSTREIMSTSQLNVTDNTVLNDFILKLQCIPHLEPLRKSAPLANLNKNSEFAAQQ